LTEEDFEKRELPSSSINYSWLKSKWKLREIDNQNPKGAKNQKVFWGVFHEELQKTAWPMHESSNGRLGKRKENKSKREKMIGKKSGEKNMGCR